MELEKTHSYLTFGLELAIAADLLPPCREGAQMFIELLGRSNAESPGESDPPTPPPADHDVVNLGIEGVV
ncbi:Protein of unknown function [Pyronema omphalodes CBS 100304]|uniref:Uncharacterized protein n=1 Tax=Pyronema omphalodes (strain CBS 100304) TaxID=1076935 RepID=U4LTM6_PYROM|nr:Protein of unknown function [Pyronema omphalodes CBS 100304]